MDIDRDDESGEVVASLFGVEMPQAPTASNIAEILFSMDPATATLLSATATADLIGVAPTHYRTVLSACAYRGLAAKRRHIQTFLLGVPAYCDQNTRGGVVVQHALFVKSIKYDSTPSRKLRVRTSLPVLDADARTAATASLPSVKVLVFECRWRAILRQQLPGASKWLHIHGNWPTKLKVLQQGRGEDLFRALPEVDIGVESEIGASRRVVGVTVDDDGANDRCELLEDERLPGVAKVVLKCTLHKKYAVIKHTMPTAKALDSKLIRLALALINEPAGHITLIKEIRHILRTQMCIIHDGQRTAQQADHAEAAWRAYLDTDKVDDAKRYEALNFLFNGDLQNVRIEHFERGCCRSPRHTLLMMQTTGVATLLPRAISVIQRQDWTGMETGVKDVGLASSVHNILPQALLRIFKSKIVAQPPPVAPHAIGGDADQPMPMQDAIADVGEAGLAGVEREVKGAPVSIYAEDHSVHVASVREWASGGSLQKEVMLFQIPYKHFLVMMKSDLHVGSRQWERRQQRRCTQEGRRDYPILIANRVAAEWSFLAQISKLIGEASEWNAMPMGEGKLTEVDQLDAYVVCSRLGGLTYLLCVVLQRWFPWLTFDGQNGIDSMRSSPLCTQDAYAKNLIAHYGNALGGPMYFQEIEAGLQQFDAQMNSTERIHGQNLRRALCRCLTAGEMSADLCSFFVGRQISYEEQGLLRHSDDQLKRLAQESRAAKRAVKRAEKMKKKKEALEVARGKKVPTRTGAGGTWRAWVKSKAGGRKLTKEIAQELSASYRERLNDDEHLRDLGAHLTTLGRLRRSCKLPARANLQKSKRKQRSCKPRALLSIDDALATDDPSGLHVVPACGREETSSLAEAVLLAEVESDFALSSVRVVQEARDKAQIAHITDTAVEVDLQRWATNAMPQVVETWGGAASGCKLELSPQQHIAETHVCNWSTLPGVTAKAASIASVPEETQEEAAAKWENDNHIFLAADSVLRPDVKTSVNLCFDAQRCVCEGQGYLQQLFRNNILNAHQQLGKLMPEKDARRLIQSNHLVYWLVFEKPLSALADDTDSNDSEFVIEYIVQLCVQYLDRSKKSCYLFLDRFPQEDRPGCIGVTPNLEYNPEFDLAMLQWKTFWEMVDVLCLGRSIITLHWCKLFADKDRSVDMLEPFRQRIKVLPLDTIVVWSGAKAELEADEALRVAAKERAAKQRRRRAGVEKPGRSRGRGRGSGKGRSTPGTSAPSTLEPIEGGDDNSSDLCAPPSDDGGGSGDMSDDSVHELSQVGSGDDPPHESSNSSTGSSSSSLSTSSSPTELSLPSSVADSVPIRVASAFFPRAPPTTTLPWHCGRLKYYSKKRMFAAECGRSKHGSFSCKITRTANDRGVLASMAAWIRYYPCHVHGCVDTRKHHVHTWTPSPEQVEQSQKDLVELSKTDHRALDLLSHDRGAHE